MLKIQKLSLNHPFRILAKTIWLGGLVLMLSLSVAGVANAQCPTIALGPTFLPNGIAGANYNQLITATGGSPPYEFTVTGALPPGVKLSTAGVLTGVPVITGEFSFTVKARDRNNCEASRSFMLLVDCPAPVELSSLQLPSAVLGQAYRQRLPANTMFVPAKFTTVETLPPGLNLSESGVLSGTVTIPGQFNFRVKQSDLNGCESFRRYRLTVYGPVCARIFTIVQTSLPNPTEGRIYNQKLTVSGDGIPSYRFSVSEGTLPEGLALSPEGILSGTPVRGGSSSFTIQVEDAQCYAIQAYSMRVNPGRVVTINNLGKIAGIPTVFVQLESLGNENSLGFSLLYPSGEWRFALATLSNGGTGATVKVSETGNGLGVRLALPAGQVFAAGTRYLLTLTFSPATTDPATQFALALADAPVAREAIAADGSQLLTSFEMYAPGFPIHVSAASFRQGELARGQFATAFGTNLATQTAMISSVPLPTELAGTRVTITDSRNIKRDAPLYFVSPGQINYQIPPETAEGIARISIVKSDSSTLLGIAAIASVAPSIFTVDASGAGLPAAVALRVNADGKQAYEPIVRFDRATNRFVAVPINLDAQTDQVFAVLYGTGIRGRSALSQVQCLIDGIACEVQFAGAADEFTGVDQINVRLPGILIGRGEVDAVLTVDGKTANTVRLNIK